ncbi:WD40 repeat-like protein [Hesseltinella vesiculosa]|uniref:WD40 repeat-like protein n=1 Tax=Hesseltinella vesiculosa TaxID=101127 RepID=A0A1X2GXZ9_9FUNG|nr:WD40 repeat-like protein [Hesseltinella vesiculosa]
MDTDEVLSKETRKLRKKKISFDSDDDEVPSAASRRSGRKADASLKVRSAGQKAQDDSPVAMVDDPMDLSPPSTPVPRHTTINSTDKGKGKEQDLVENDPMDLNSAFQDEAAQDSMDGYDTDDLLDQIERLPPLRFKLPNGRGKRTPASNVTGKGRRGRKKPELVYNQERTTELAKAYPDTYWQWNMNNGHMVQNVNKSSPLVSVHKMNEQGSILGISLSEDGLLLATFSVFGSVRIYDVQDDFKLLAKLRDNSEEQIEEYYCGLFKGSYLVTGGKLKDRQRWSAEDEDNHILPCPIKTYDLVTQKVVSVLNGHAEEILCIKSVKFDGKNYYISTSQDGYIIKWSMEDDWTTLIDFKQMGDGITCMAFTVSFVPNTGNKYFMGACDAHARLYDFEEAQLMQTFENLYSSYCDCGRFVDWVDADVYLEQVRQTKQLGKAKQEDDSESLVDIEEEDEDDAPFAWFITRGAEMCDDDGLSTEPNTCTLHKLIYPKVTGKEFKLQEVKRYEHKDYHSNSWFVKVCTNGRYIFAPTVNGQVFVFNLLTGQTTAILKYHGDIEIRDVIIHPYLPLLISCGDDGLVNVCSYDEAD